MSWFEKLEKPALLPLPQTRYEFAEWKKLRVNIDYHIDLLGHFYSVPYSLIHQLVQVRYTESTVEIFHKGKRIASHKRGHGIGLHTTLNGHMPARHQKYLEWTPSRMIAWAQKTGSSCADLVRHILENRPHPEQGFRSCLGIIRLGKTTGQERLEAACRRALHFGTCSYQSVKSILEHRLDQQPVEQELPLKSPPHQNLRGRNYYH